jgi:hypothetical protein
MKTGHPLLPVLIAGLLLAGAVMLGWTAHSQHQRATRLTATLAEMRVLEQRAHHALHRMESLATTAKRQQPVALDVLLRTYWEHPGARAENGERVPFDEGWTTEQATLTLARVAPADLLVFARTVARQDPPWVLSRVALRADEGMTLSGDVGFEMLLPDSINSSGEVTE